MAKLTKRFRKRRGTSKKRIQRRKRSTMRYFGGRTNEEMLKEFTNLRGEYTKLDPPSDEQKSTFKSNITKIKNEYIKLNCKNIITHCTESDFHRDPFVLSINELLR